MPKLSTERGQTASLEEIPTHNAAELYNYTDIQKPNFFGTTLDHKSP